MSVGIYKQTARDIMTKHVATIRSMETIHDALELMAENHLSAIPVVDQRGSCVGIVSQADIIGFARDADEDDQPVNLSRNLASIMSGGIPLDQITRERIDEVMSDHVIVANANESAISLADKMISYEIHHVPVVDDDDQLLGIVSTIDILKGLRQTIAH